VLNPADEPIMPNTIRVTAENFIRDESDLYFSTVA